MAKTQKRQSTSNPALLATVKAILKDLAGHGWEQVFAMHGLDIVAPNLRSELTRKLETIDREAPGFDDFAAEGTRGIEIGKPALSLLWHGLASPHVGSYIATDGKPAKVSRFATPAELEAVENLTYGLEPPTINGLRAKAGGAPLAIVVFAQEYRPAINTVHRHHADMCYARTGVARVGTKEHCYLPEARGYLPFVEDNGKAIRVLPCRYAAYVSVLAEGDEDGHGPMRFRAPGTFNARAQAPPKQAGVLETRDVAADQDPGDRARLFWVPLHKLYPGKECIAGFDLDVSLSAHHVNEKIRRTHQFFLRHLHDGGWGEPDISQPPFIFSEGIADWSSDPVDGFGLLVPTVHDAIATPARYKGKDLTYIVPNSEVDSGEPERPVSTFSSSLLLRPLPSNARSAPEYVHARTAVDWGGGGEKDLNTLPEVEKLVSKGEYRAKHYVDFTGDGWIEVECRALALEIPHRLSAFSLVAAVDYFPGVKQRDLMQWWEQSVPASVRDTIWPESPGAPEALSDQRFVANLELEGARFSDNDDTMTAIVGAFGTGQGRQTRVSPPAQRRSSMLPDGASGIYAPGWDSSVDQRPPGRNQAGETVPAVYFLASYGLGSPFPEDSKLCAALSAFWPAVSPDTERTFEPRGVYATATPLTDEVLGQDGSTPWDGIAGPAIRDRRKKLIEYNSLAYGDYVAAAINNVFDMGIIGKTTPHEYIARTVAMARVYQALGATGTGEKRKFAVFSFTQADSRKDSQLRKAMKQTGHQLADASAYRVVIYQPKSVKDQSKKPFNKSWCKYDKLNVFYADPNTVLLKGESGGWTANIYTD